MLTSYRFSGVIRNISELVVDRPLSTRTSEAFCSFSGVISTDLNLHVVRLPTVG